MLGSISINAGVSKCPARKAICSSVGWQGSSWSKKPSEVMLGASCVFLDLMENLTDPSPPLSSPLVNKAARSRVQPSALPPPRPGIGPLWRASPPHSLSFIIDCLTTTNTLLMDLCHALGRQHNLETFSYISHLNQLLFLQSSSPRGAFCTHTTSVHALHTLPAILANANGLVE